MLEALGTDHTGFSITSVSRTLWRTTRSSAAGRAVSNRSNRRVYSIFRHFMRERSEILGDFGADLSAVFEFDDKLT